MSPRRCNSQALSLSGTNSALIAGHAGRIVESDNLPVLQALPGESVQLVYTDPPFNTGNVRTYQRLRTVQDDDGDRSGFGGRRYRTEQASSHAYADAFEQYIEFLRHPDRRLRPKNRRPRRTCVKLKRAFQ